MFQASRQSPLLSSLGDSMKVGRLPSAGITQLPRYLCAPPTSRPPVPDFGCPYTEPSRPSPASNEISRVTRCSFPRMPSRRPRRVHLLLISVSPHRWRRPSPLDHRVGTLNQQVTRLYGFPGGTACEFAILPEESFLDPLSPESRPSKPDLR